MNFVSVNVRSKSHPHLALQLAADTVVEKFTGYICTGRGKALDCQTQLYHRMSRWLCTADNSHCVSMYLLTANNTLAGYVYQRC